MSHGNEQRGQIPITAQSGRLRASPWPLRSFCRLQRPDWTDFIVHRTPWKGPSRVRMEAWRKGIFPTVDFLDSLGRTWMSCLSEPRKGRRLAKRFGASAELMGRVGEERAKTCPQPGTAGSGAGWGPPRLLPSPRRPLRWRVRGGAARVYGGADAQPTSWGRTGPGWGLCLAHHLKWALILRKAQKIGSSPQYWGRCPQTPTLNLRPCSRGGYLLGGKGIM